MINEKARSFYLLMLTSEWLH